MKTTRRSFFGLVAKAGLGGKRALAETTEKLGDGDARSCFVGDRFKYGG